MKKAMRVDAFVYNSVLSAFGRAGNLKEMVNFFHKMLNDSVKANEVTYNTLISYFGREGDVSSMMKYYRILVMTSSHAYRSKE
jgi:pentatricopeptide repeat protein